MCLCLILTWHPRVLGTPLNSSEHFFLSEEFPVPAADTQIWAFHESGRNPSSSEGCHLLHSAAPQGMEQDLGQQRLCSLCSLCQNLLPKEPSTAPQWYRHFPQQGQGFSTPLRWFYSDTGMFSLCLLWAVVSSQSPALSLLSLLRKALCSSSPQFFAQDDFLSTITSFSPFIFKPDSYFRLISV